MKRVCLAVLCLLVSGCMTLRRETGLDRPLTFRELPRDDRQYLQELARETWECIDYLAHEPSQLPFDSTAKKKSGDGQTSVSNIGLYAADIVAAFQLGYLSREEAVARLDRLVQSLGQFRRWRGWTQSWNDARSFQPSPHDPWVSVLDTGNLVAGLIAARAAFPEVRGRIDEFVDGMDWVWMADPDAKKVRFGFNTKKGEEGGPIGDLGSDNRLAAFFAMACGALPPESWDELNRSLEERYGLHYLLPGWQGGGLFMPFLGGIFFDDAGTLIGRSQANFAYAQIVHAGRIGSPVWGWSASESPEYGYLGWNRIMDEIVTPHACVLAIEMYPRRVLANLRALEALGARDPIGIRGEPRRFGFRDAVNTRTGRTTENMLVLDQSMLFLSLANYITGEQLRQAFQSDPLIQKGRALASDYAGARSLGEEAVLARRDAEPAGETVIPLPLGIPITGFRTYAGTSRLERVAKKSAVPIEVDGRPDEWVGDVRTGLSPLGNLASGTVSGPQDLDAWFAVRWDDRNLFVCMMVTDDDITNSFPARDMWRGDCIELFVDPQGEGFTWGDRRDFQIGFAPSAGGDGVQVWSWFQQENPSGVIRAAISVTPTGYGLEAAIPWEYLGVEPSAGMELGLSPGLHDLDPSGPECKLDWSYQPDGKNLGRLVLGD